VNRTDPSARGTAREDFDELAERYAAERRAGDDARTRRARDEMICAVLPLAERLARRYRGGAEPLADLEQVARLGLVKAVDRYDPERGSFTAYAVHTVMGELKRHLRDRTWGVHVPRRMQELVLAVTQREAELTLVLGRSPTSEELARESGIGAAELDNARVTAAGYRTISLSTPIGDDGRQFGDLLGDPDDALEKAADRLTVANLMTCLPDRERHVVVSIFYGSRTQADIAAELGISQMQVSRILTRVLSWLRDGLLTDQIPRWPVEIGRAAVSEVSRGVLAGGGFEVTVTGEVDRDNAGRLLVELLELVCSQRRGGRVVLRLGRVPLLDAAGVRVLLAVYEAARVRGVRVTAVGLTPFVRKIALVSGLQPMLAPGEDEEPGIAGCGAR
jgi:RNA polymerase sigma-B factor